eukprot:m.757623 g.757623  ORF g.757623 m.757623 type:complete len:726 (-) comp59025_c0_seq1:1856-4033(-)
MSEEGRRVKAYKAEAEGEWGEQGTGPITFDMLAGRPLFVVRSELDGSIVLEIDIRPRLKSFALEDSLLYWDEGEDTKFCLSFQTQQGADEIWNHINSLRREESPDDKDNDSLIAHADMADTADSQPTVDLPPVETQNLDKILETIRTVWTARQETFTRADREFRLFVAKQLESLCIQLRSNDYIPQLLNLFRMKEDMQDLDSLHKIYEIFRSLFILSQSELFDVMLDKDLILDVIGTLEYDPVRNKQHYRDFLTSKAQLKEIVPLSNQALIDKIHVAYRIQYLKDVILASSMDDVLFTTLNAIVQLTNVEILNLVQRDESIIAQVIDGLKDIQRSRADRLDLMKFLLELFKLSQHLKPDEKRALYSSLGERGLFDILASNLSFDDVGVKLLVCNVFALLQFQDITILRNHIAKQAHMQRHSSKSPQESLLGRLVHSFATVSDKAVLLQLTVILRMLLDKDTFETMLGLEDRDGLLKIFYDDFANELVAPLLVSDFDVSEIEVERRSQILHVLGLFAVQHGARIRTFLARPPILQAILNLINLKNFVLTLGSIQLIKSMLMCKNEILIRAMIRIDLFGALVQTLVDGGARYTLVNSTVLELLELIRRENWKNVIEAIVKRHELALRQLKYSTVFADFMLRYDQNNTPYTTDATASPATTERKQPTHSSMDAEEEEYFNESGDDDEAPPAPPAVGSPVSVRPRPSLVDYDDDEDDFVSRVAKRKPQS